MSTWATSLADRQVATIMITTITTIIIILIIMFKMSTWVTSLADRPACLSRGVERSGETGAAGPT